MRDSRETLTKKAFVTGFPVKHSRSPMIHGYWLKQFGIDGTYSAHPVEPENFLAFLQSLRSGESGYVGGNVTIPHKEAAYRLSDAPDALAEELGAANTLWVEGGRVHATNTDGRGFIANLDQRHPGWDAPAAGTARRAVILGAGGAARAVIQALRDRGFDEVHVVNRTLARAQEMRDRFGERVHAHPMDALREVMDEASLFVNTTSLGMDGEPAPDIDFSPLASGGIVTDIVYVPLVTPILRQAMRQGRPVVDGLGMLLHQAVPGFEIWFGRRPEVDETLRNLIIADMEAHS
ncbi:shikimate dehydrogenase [Gellertiella hungarica]|uniref:Shikimate dehydrogenase (NADP(+)) n=1 Tax=Gellertiella hungarica TaxID=1572859 RepID=A0A7W6J8R2_9HYPH|nr:shikimate dehydrogenase [Gellertiella hungarica]MBB4066856.1 shikimate dehydrogenase [Gellertiella hungarica]